MTHGDKWECIGVIGVDAGLCWVGDPCYILHKSPQAKEAHERTPKDIGTDWRSFCNRLDGDTTQFNYDMGHAGLGVAVSTGWGDGSYPVYVKRDPETGRVAEVRVVFIDNENDGSEER